MQAELFLLNTLHVLWKYLHSFCQDTTNKNYRSGARSIYFSFSVQDTINTVSKLRLSQHFERQQSLLANIIK